MVVTHDPVLALLTDKRIIMKNGGMRSVVSTTPEERHLAGELGGMDELLFRLREMVRNGESCGDVFPPQSALPNIRIRERGRIPV
jgi:hypothetical protein